MKFLQGLGLDDQQSPCNDESLFYVLFSLSSTEARMYVKAVAIITGLEMKTIQEILLAIGSQAQEDYDLVEMELISHLEQDERILRSTVDPETYGGWTKTSSIPLLSFLALEPYVHFEFALRFAALWLEISRAYSSDQFLYVNILCGALLEGLLMTGLHVIGQGPNLHDRPTQVLADLQKDAWNLSWLIQLGGVNRMFDERTRQAFHRIRELRNDVHFLYKGQRSQFFGLGDDEDADFAINTIVEFVPKLKIWVQKRGTSKYT